MSTEDTMSPTEEAEVRQRLHDLTDGCEPGPWKAVSESIPQHGRVFERLDNAAGDSSFPDPEDIAAMFNALPRLLAEIDRLRATPRLTPAPSPDALRPVIPADAERALTNYWWHHGSEPTGMNGSTIAAAVISDLRLALAARCPVDAAAICTVDHRAALATTAEPPAAPPTLDAHYFHAGPVPDRCADCGLDLRDLAHRRGRP